MIIMRQRNRAAAAELNVIPAMLPLLRESLDPQVPLRGSLVRTLIYALYVWFAANFRLESGPSAS